MLIHSLKMQGLPHDSGNSFSLSITFLAGMCFPIMLWMGGCQPDKATFSASGYPEDIAPLIVSSCAVSGCHNAQSAFAAGGLNLESWDDLFEGSRGGSPVVPHAPQLSYLLYSVNTDPNLGSTLSPTMPFNQPALSSEEYALLWNWIYEGAPNARGELRFPPTPDRGKWYVGHQICDEVAVFDAESRQIMRYVDVGSDPVSVEYVFDIRVSPDGKDWFVVFFGPKSFISRYSTLTDEKVTDIETGTEIWSTLSFSPDSRFAFLGSEYLFRLMVIDLETNAPVGPIKTFNYEVRGPVVHPNRKQVYMAEYQDRGLTIVDYDEEGNLSNSRTLDIVQHIPPQITGDVWPFEILFLPDGSKYFVSCTNSKEIRVMDGETDALLAVIEMPDSPSRMAYAASTGHVFVSCMEDLKSWPVEPHKRGSVVAIDAKNHHIVKKLYSGFQPYALAADDANGVIVVSNRNSDVTGPVPHHTSACEGRNGYVTLIDLQTLTVVDDYQPEILADPSTVASK